MTLGGGVFETKGADVSKEHLFRMCLCNLVEYSACLQLEKLCFRPEHKTVKSLRQDGKVRSPLGLCSLGIFEEYDCGKSLPGLVAFFKMED